LPLLAKPRKTERGAKYFPAWIGARRTLCALAKPRKTERGAKYFPT